jgi:hypothetical protein
MKDLNLSDYLIPASFLIGPAVNLYTYLKEKKTGDEDKDKLINENRKLKRNKLSNTVYGNLGYIASILAAYGYWQNRKSLNSQVASLKDMITNLRGDNDDNAIKLEGLQEDYLTLQSRLQNELIRSELLSNKISEDLASNVFIRNNILPNFYGILRDHPDSSEFLMSTMTGMQASDVYDSVREYQGGEGIIKNVKENIKKWLPVLGLIAIAIPLKQQNKNFTNLLNEKLKGIYDTLNSTGLNIGFTTNDVNRLIFDSQVYHNYLNFFGIVNDETKKGLEKGVFRYLDNETKDLIYNERMHNNYIKNNVLNRFENIKQMEKTIPELYARLLDRLKDYTSPPPNLESMGNFFDITLPTPFMTPSEMREIADVNRSMRNLPASITEIKGKEKLIDNNYYGFNIINMLLSSFPGLISADAFPQVTHPIRERAYYRNLKRFNKDKIFERFNKLTMGDDSTTWEDRYKE